MSLGGCLEGARATPVFGWHNLTCHIMAIIALVRDQPRLLIEGVSARPRSWCHGNADTRQFFASAQGSTRTLTLQAASQYFMLAASFQPLSQLCKLY